MLVGADMNDIISVPAEHQEPRTVRSNLSMQECDNFPWKLPSYQKQGVLGMTEHSYYRYIPPWEGDRRRSTDAQGIEKYIPHTHKFYRYGMAN